MKQILYEQFTSANDTSLSSTLKDSEFRALQNMDYEGGGVVTRPGSYCASLAGGVASVDPVLEVLEVVVRGVACKLVVTQPSNNASLGFMQFADTHPLVTRNYVEEPANIAALFRVFQLKDRVFASTGESLREIANLDYPWNSRPTNVDIKVGDVAETGPGLYGYYRAKVARTGVNLATDSFGNATNWESIQELVTIGVPNVAREVVARDAATKEKVKLVIGYNAAAAGNVTVTLNGASTVVAISAGDTASAVAGRLRAATYAGWTVSGSGMTVYFTAATAVVMDDTLHVYDAGVTQAYGVMTVATQGAPDDNAFSSVRRCTQFLQHPKSRRFFAIGNPLSPTTVYMSGTVQYPDDVTYWKSSNQLNPLTPESEALVLILLSESILVGFSNNWYAYTGVDPAVDATWRILNLPMGPVSADAAAPVPNGFVYLSKSGLIEVSAAILNTEILLLQSQPTINNLSEDKIKSGLYLNEAVKAQLVYMEGKLFIRIARSHNTLFNLIVYDFHVGGFTFYTGPVFRWLLASTTKELYFASGKQVRYLHKEATKDYPGTPYSSGTGVDITSELRTKDFDMGNNLSSKYLMNLFILLKQYTGTEPQLADIILLGDYAKDEVDGLSLTYNQTELDESLVWGRTWGKIWGFAEMMEMESHPNVKSRTFGVKIRSSSPIGFYGVGFGYKELRAQGREMTSGRELIE